MLPTLAVYVSYLVELIRKSLSPVAIADPNRKMALHAVSLGGDNLGIRPLVIGAVFNAVATIAVLLRVLSARMGKCRTLHADDYMILLALVRLSTYFALNY